MRQTALISTVMVMILLGGWLMIGAPAPWSPVGGERESAAVGPETLALGEAVYSQNCAACHGDDREGQENWRERGEDGKLPAPPLDGSGHTWHHPDDELLAIIEQGIEPFAPEGYRSDMKGFGGRLSEAEMRAVLAYLKAEWPEDKRQRQAEINARARE